MTLFIIDASAYQATLPIDKLPGQGFAAIILKATEDRLWTSSSFRAQLATARATKRLLVAAYHYLHLGAEVTQARHACAVVPRDIPLWVDVEAGASLSGANIFADEARRLGWTIGGIYASSRPPDGHGGWWRPAYLGDPTGYASSTYLAQGADSGSGWAKRSGRVPDLWQYCQHGRVTGYSGGDIDFSAYRGTVAQLAGTGWFWVPEGLIPNPPNPSPVIEQGVDMDLYQTPNGRVWNLDSSGAILLGNPATDPTLQDDLNQWARNSGRTVPVVHSDMVQRFQGYGDSIRQHIADVVIRNLPPYPVVNTDAIVSAVSASVEAAVVEALAHEPAIDAATVTAAIFARLAVLFGTAPVS